MSKEIDPRHVLTLPAGSHLMKSVLRDGRQEMLSMITAMVMPGDHYKCDSVIVLSVAGSWLVEAAMPESAGDYFVRICTGPIALSDGKRICLSCGHNFGQDD